MTSQLNQKLLDAIEKACGEMVRDRTAEMLQKISTMTADEAGAYLLADIERMKAKTKAPDEV